MTRQQNGIKYLLLSVIWTVLSLVVLLAPKESIKASGTLAIPGLDKVAHFVLFAIWIFLVAKAISERRKSIHWMTLLGVFIFVAILTEVVQQQIGRNIEVLDILADVIGLIAGLLIYKRV